MTYSSRVTSNLKMVLFNPLSGWGERLEEIVRVTAPDVLFLAGTQQKVTDRSRGPVKTFTVPGTRRQAWEWGWASGGYSNRSCGVSIVLGPRLRRFVSQVYTPPAYLWGRAGALRVRAKTVDLLLVSCYLPCRDYGDRTDLSRRDCVQAILAWMYRLIHQSPRRTLPVIAGDMNAKFGLQKGMYLGADTQVGVPTVKGEESHVSASLREWAASLDLRFETTFHSTVKSTFFSSTSPATSLIDHVVLPVAAAPLVVNMYTDRRLMKQLQLIATKAPADHCPVVWRMRTNLCFMQQQQDTRVDMDKLMDAVRERPLRQPFLAQLEKLCRPHRKKHGKR